MWELLLFIKSLLLVIMVQKILKNKDLLLIYDEKEKDIRIQIKSSIIKITFNEFGFKIFVDDAIVYTEKDRKIYGNFY